ncbi:FlgD immunoglobulin-like domain containing protein [Treponema sp. R6D11]
MEVIQGTVLVSVRKAAGSPDTLALNPQISAAALDETVTINLLNDNKTQINLPEGYRTIRARAFGWEDASVTVLVNEQTAVNADIIMKPAVFKLANVSQSRKRFNPTNSSVLGVTEFRFEVSAPGTGTIIITDNGGEVVYEKQLDNFETWLQSATWNGRDLTGKVLPQGIYTVTIKASALHEISNDEAKTSTLQLETEINYSFSIFPLSTESVVSGLAFTPLPHTLPAGSFQFEAGLIFKDFQMPSANVQENGVISGLPFKISMRASPVNKLELTTVFNINPLFENQTGWGVSGSLKFNILDGGTIPFAMSAAASYSWAGKNGEEPLSPGRGAGLYLPLSLELANFSLALCPAAFWLGPEGITPEFLLSAGVMYKGDWFNAGLSARSEFNFADNAKNPRILAGAQVYFFPPPSIFYFSLQGGMWKHGELSGIYGGLGLGIVY